MKLRIKNIFMSILKPFFNTNTLNVHSDIKDVKVEDG